MNANQREKKARKLCDNLKTIVRELRNAGFHITTPYVNGKIVIVDTLKEGAPSTTPIEWSSHHIEQNKLAEL